MLGGVGAGVQKVTTSVKRGGGHRTQNGGGGGGGGGVWRQQFWVCDFHTL